MEGHISFKDYVIISCGTLGPELNYLRKQGFLDARKILYTTPGRHEVLKELQSQLIQKINTAKQHSKKIIIVYGGKFCYVNIDDPYRTIDTIIAEQAVGISISRINATHCMDTLDRLKNLLADCVVSDLEKEIAELKSRLPAHSLKPPMIQQLENLEEKLENAKKARQSA